MNRVKGQIKLEENSTKTNKLKKNKNITILLSSQSISTLGDAFFNIAIMWTVYSQSSSTLQTALIGAMWHFADILTSPIAGVLADKWNNKKILICTNIMSTVVVFILFIYFLIFEHLPFILALIFIFLLNCFTAVVNPVRSSIIPVVVNPDKLASVNGSFSMFSSISSLIGNASGGFIISIFGVASALLFDSITFLIVAFLLLGLNLPNENTENNYNKRRNKINFILDIKESWQYIKESKLFKSIIFLSIFVNLASFLGPFYPALVTEQLEGNSTIYGFIQAGAVIGSITGGLLIGYLERKIGAGKLISISWGIAAISIIGVSFSENVYITISLSFLQLLGVTLGAISISTIIMTSAPSDIRGRIIGLTTSLSILIIPIMNILVGWIGEYIRVSYIFIIAGTIILLASIFSYTFRSIRIIKISNITDSKAD